MKPSTVKALFEKAGINIRQMWETRYSDPEIPHLNQSSTNDTDCEDFVSGYFLMTDYGQMEIRYGLTSIMIREVTDHSHNSYVIFQRILPTPVNMLDTSVIISSLRYYREHRYA